MRFGPGLPLVADRQTKRRAKKGRFRRVDTAPGVPDAPIVITAPSNTSGHRNWFSVRTISLLFFYFSHGAPFVLLVCLSGGWKLLYTHNLLDVHRKLLNTNNKLLDITPQLVRYYTLVLSDTKIELVIS